MTKKEIESANSEAIENSGIPPDNAIKDRKNFLTAKRLETVVAILLGITTLLSAWAAWIGSLHGGIQSINFTKSNNMASQGTAEYNLEMQLYLSDYTAWNIINDYYYGLESEKADGNQAEINRINNKIKNFKKQNVSDILSSGWRIITKTIPLKCPI